MKMGPVAKRTAIRFGKYRKYVRSGAWAYSEKFDAYYSVRTKKWVETKCGDKTCAFCGKRPRLAPMPK